MNDGHTIGSAHTIWEPTIEARLALAVRPFMSVRSVRQIERTSRALLSIGRPNVATSYEIVGQLTLDPTTSYSMAEESLRAQGFYPLFRQGRAAGEQIVIAIPGSLPRSSERARPAVLLFVATFVSVLSIGVAWAAGIEGFDPLALIRSILAQPSLLVDGLPYTVSLLAILLAHELGHYLMAKRLGVPSSPPFFIPMPLTYFGTLGAVMLMKAPPRTRRDLLAVAVAGPLAGLVVAIPVMLIGLSLSQVQSQPPTGAYIQEGNSILYAGLKYLVFGRFLPSGGVDVFLHPVAWAGWAGLLVTGLNLLPAGQLDGGHVAFVLLGEKAQYSTWIVIALLAALSFVWIGWVIWVAIILVFGQIHAVPLNDLTPLPRAWQVLALVMILVFVLVFIPVPLVQA